MFTSVAAEANGGRKEGREAGREGVRGRERREEGVREQRREGEGGREGREERMKKRGRAKAEEMGVGWSD